MTPAGLLALAAAVAAAAGTVDLAEALAADRHASRRPRPGGRLAGMLARWGRSVGVPVAPADLALRLAAAGLDRRVPLSELMAIKVGAALAALLVALPLVASAPGRSGLLLGAVATAAGYPAPDLLLRRRARRRMAAIALEVPDVLDLVRLALDAGLPPVRALGEAGRRRGGLLGRELATAAARIEMGERRDAALQGLADRAPLPEVAALVAAVRRAERHGSPPVPAIAALAADARAARARALRDQAARAAPKIQLVIALLLVPAVLLLVAAGLVRGLTA